MRFGHFFIVLGLTALFLLEFSSVQALEETLRPAPEIATGLNTVKAARGSKMMAVTAHPEATRVAYDILKRGGTAMDAAVAAQLILGLVEPQSSGLGGGGFAIYYDATARQVFSYDGRETAPQNVGSHLFIDSDGKPIRFYEAVVGGRAVGVPGMPRLLEMMHRVHGELSWRELFSPAIQLAEGGFDVTPRLHQSLTASSQRFDIDTKTKLQFFPDGKTPIQVGERLGNSAYAATLRTLAQDGVDAFYQGHIAKDIVAKVRGIKSNPGQLSLEDFTSYRAKMRNTVCDTYRGYKICSMGEPSSGGLTLLQTLRILEQFNLKALGANNPKSWHIIAEASRLAFADRNKYIADSDFTETPGLTLLDEQYIKARAKLINPEKAMMDVSAGQPDFENQQAFGADNKIKNTGTTHISIVDSIGNIVSMTSSIETAFGSHVMVNGFLLNNQLTDFSFKPNDEKGRLIANKVEGGKRPRSSMTPTIIFDPKGQPFMVIGSAGGSRIIGYVLQRIIAAIDWGMPIDQSIAAPHILHRGQKLEVETSGLNKAEPLKNLGHPVLVGEMNSGLTAIQFNGRQMVGVADPRREGVALGE
ncbi:MAG: gamma-glutamyltransferase [Pseudomonadota bacterium]